MRSEKWGVGEGGRRGCGVVWAEGGREELMRRLAARREVGEGGRSMSGGGSV